MQGGCNYGSASEAPSSHAPNDGDEAEYRGRQQACSLMMSMEPLSGESYPRSISENIIYISVFRGTGWMKHPFLFARQKHPRTPGQSTCEVA